MKRIPLILAFLAVFLVLFTPSLPVFAGQIRVLFLGDSLTSGLGVAPEEAYPAVIQNLLIQKKISHITIINGGISGSTSASGVSRLRWFLKSKPDILVLALGANDGLRGLSVDKMEKNLDDTISLALGERIRVILAGMEIPPNYGSEYAGAFREVFRRLAKKHRIPLIPFLLKDVAGNFALNQPDGIHPNPEGHKVIAGHVLPFILENQ